jgi:hypothetical protein
MTLTGQEYVFDTWDKREYNAHYIKLKARAREVHLAIKENRVLEINYNAKMLSDWGDALLNDSAC